MDLHHLRGTVTLVAGSQDPKVRGIDNISLFTKRATDGPASCGFPAQQASGEDLLSPRQSFSHRSLVDVRCRVTSGKLGFGAKVALKAVYEGRGSVGTVPRQLMLEPFFFPFALGLCKLYTLSHTDHRGAAL